MGSADKAERLLRVACAACALAMIPLSLRPWLNIHWSSGFPPGSGTARISGDDLPGLTDFGDDWIVIVVAIAAALVAAASFASRYARPLAGPMFALLALSVLVVTGYDAAHDWRSDYGFQPHVNISEVNVSLPLWGVLALSVPLFLGGLILVVWRNGRGMAKFQPDTGQA